MLTERATQLALGIAAAIIAASVAAWLYSESLANTLLAAVSAAATTATAIMVKELEIAVKQLRFEAVKEAYGNLDNREFKDTVEKKICPWLKENLDQVDWLTCSKHGEKAGKTWEEIKQATRYASISLNKTGFLVYMEFIDPKPLAEELGGLILRSFTCLRPLLVCMRNTSEPPTQPWFMRRFALLLTLYTEHYLAKQWRQYLAGNTAMERRAQTQHRSIQEMPRENRGRENSRETLPRLPTRSTQAGTTSSREAGPGRRDRRGSKPHSGMHSRKEMLTSLEGLAPQGHTSQGKEAQNKTTTQEEHPAEMTVHRPPRPEETPTLHGRSINRPTPRTRPSPRGTSAGGPVA